MKTEMYIIRVVNDEGDFWLGHRVYRSYDSALTVRRNLINNQGRYKRVYICQASEEQITSAFSIGNWLPKFNAWDQFHALEGKTEKGENKLLTN